jgi:TetR/AcrR family transcriptional regulator, regulator of cefoperazone and chloramphenicol sensitivity
MLFAKLFDATVAGMRSLVEPGIARPARDERIRTAFLLANDLSLMLLHPQIAQATGTDPLTREGLANWTATVMDVYTGGVFAAVPVPGKQAPDQPPGKGDRYR